VAIFENQNQNNKMKKYKILSGVMAAAVLGGASALASFNYQNGDLLAAFGDGGSTDVIVDLGAIANYQAGATTQTFDLNAVLTSVFGSVNSGIYWSVFGVNDTSIGGSNPSVTQTDANTVWASLARSNPAVKSTTPHVSGNSASQGLVVGDIQTIANLTLPSQAGPGLITDYAAGIELVNKSLGGFTSLMSSPYNGNFQGDLTFNTLNNGAGTSDLYQSNPGNHNTQSATYLGNYSLSAGGSLTFNPAAVPEPSTWAMVGSGALALLALRRRK
jgi:hypothetical protein